MENVQDTLDERGKQYGEFAGHAEISQNLKAFVTRTPGYQKMHRYEREALEMILHKVARICNGNPHFDDSWRDIAGYAQLVVNELSKDVVPGVPETTRSETFQKKLPSNYEMEQDIKKRQARAEREKAVESEKRGNTFQEIAAELERKRQETTPYPEQTIPNRVDPLNPKCIICGQAPAIGFTGKCMRCINRPIL